MQELINSFLNHLVVEKGFSHNTLDAYRNDLYQFMDYAKVKFANANGSLSWRDIDIDLLTDYVFDLRGKKSYRDSTTCLLYTSPSPRDRTRSRMPSSA